MSINNKKNEVELICIGTELLLGNIVNSNAKWLAEQFALLGLDHYRQSVIGDNYDRLKHIILEASQRSQILITTGGLGPTPDDLTTETIASAFDTELIFEEDIWKDIQTKFKTNKNIPNNNKKQALIPSGAKILPNPLGTAPGIIWTPKANFTIITFPGVPSEMKRMWDETAKPWLLKNYPSDFIFASKTINFVGISESLLVEKIQDLLETNNPTVAPYASLGQVKLRLTAHAKNKKEANILISPIESELHKRFGLHCYGEDDESLVSIVINLLRKRNETISFAESCTGGGLSAAFTSVPGASDVFLGGVVAYKNEIKTRVLQVPIDLIEKHGAVSAPVARSMALGVKKIFKSNWSISVSGIAGPTGSTIQRPVGLVEFYFDGPNFHESFKEEFGSHRERSEIQKLSVLRALDRLRLFLLT